MSIAGLEADGRRDPSISRISAPAIGAVAKLRALLASALGRAAAIAAAACRPTRPR